MCACAVHNRLTTRGTSMTTINCAPTWETAVEIILLTLEHGGPDMRRPARTELLRLARAMDEINKQSVRADLNNLFEAGIDE